MLAVMRTSHWILLLAVSVVFLARLGEGISWPNCNTNCLGRTNILQCIQTCLHTECGICRKPTNPKEKGECDQCKNELCKSCAVNDEKCDDCRDVLTDLCEKCATTGTGDKDCNTCKVILTKSTNKCGLCNRLSEETSKKVDKCRGCRSTTTTTTTTTTPKATTTTPIRQWPLCDECRTSTTVKKCVECLARNSKPPRCDICQIKDNGGDMKTKCNDCIQDNEVVAMCEKCAVGDDCTQCETSLQTAQNKCRICELMKKDLSSNIGLCIDCTPETTRPPRNSGVTSKGPSAPKTSRTSKAPSTTIGTTRSKTPPPTTTTTKPTTTTKTTTTAPRPRTTTPKVVSTSPPPTPSPARTSSTRSTTTTLATPHPPPNRPLTVPQQITYEPEPATEPPIKAVATKPSVEGNGQKEDEGSNLTAVFVGLGVGAVVLLLVGAGVATGLVVRKKLKNKKKNKGSVKTKEDLERALVEAEAHGVAGDVGMGLVADLPPVPMPVRRPIHAKRQGAMKTTGPVRQMEAGKIIKTGFAFEGPLHFDATGNHGPLVHATEGQKSHSLRDVFFSDQMNRVFDMGSEIEHVVKSEEHDVSKKKSTVDEQKKDSKKDSKKNTTPPAPPAPDPNQPPPPPSQPPVTK